VSAPGGEPAAHDAGGRGWSLGPLLVGVALVLFGIVLVVATTRIAGPGGYGVSGPRFFPLVVAVGMVALGAGVMIRSTVLVDRDLAEQAAAEEAVTHWPTVGALMAILVVYALALDAVGYVLATALCFVALARVLGSARPVRDAVAGLAISVIVYVAFTQFLGVRLPSGLLPSL
jgi:putative tricarboxylic transport membrane protein